ncbi:coiled-coil domain-containing protein 8 [Erethizon dorsatum]
MQVNCYFYRLCGGSSSCVVCFIAELAASELPRKLQILTQDVCGWQLWAQPFGEGADVGPGEARGAATPPGEGSEAARREWTAPCQSECKPRRGGGPRSGGARNFLPCAPPLGRVKVTQRGAGRETLPGAALKASGRLGLLNRHAEPSLSTKSPSQCPVAILTQDGAQEEAPEARAGHHVGSLGRALIPGWGGAALRRLCWDLFPLLPGLGAPTPDFTLEILKTLEKSHVGGWFPWGFLPSPDCLILWSVPDVCKDVDLDVLVEALKPVGTFKKIGKVFRKEEDSTVGLLQIGEDVDYLLIPREVRLAGGVWRVISKPATKEAEFRERLIQFLEEEGRTLEDVARIIEKSTPHPPQSPKKPKEPRTRRRVQQAVTPPPRLVVGTYDSSNASASEFSDFETSRGQGLGRARKARRMPVSYLGSKFLGSDLEREDDEEQLVQAFLRLGEEQPRAPPAGHGAHPPVPVFEDNLGPQLSKVDRWQECESPVSWGKPKQRVKSWALRSGPEEDKAHQATMAAERDGVSTGRGADPARQRDGGVPERSPGRWKPKITWASFRRRRKEEVASSAKGAAAPAEQGPEAADDQRAEAEDNRRAEASISQVAGIADNQRAEARADQREGAGAQAIQEAGSSAAQGDTGTAPGARHQKQVKTVRFQTPGRFSWFRKFRRALWHTPRLPALPERVPRAGEGRSLRVLRAEARAERGQGELEDQL